jgi:hypothetical protein
MNSLSDEEGENWNGGGCEKILSHRKVEGAWRTAVSQWPAHQRHLHLPSGFSACEPEHAYNLDRPEYFAAQAPPIEET